MREKLPQIGYEFNAIMVDLVDINDHLNKKVLSNQNELVKKNSEPNSQLETSYF